MSESLRGSGVVSSRPLDKGGTEEVMVSSASFLVAGKAFSVSLCALVDSAALCAKVPVSLLISGAGSDGFPLVHHHKGEGQRTAFVPAMWNFPCANGFLLIIRGFVKVAVFNADVIHR